MKKIYSKVSPDKLLHIVHFPEDFPDENVQRIDIVDSDNFIQCSSLNLKKDKTFRPHKHIWKNRQRDVIAQESWIVVKGSVKCFFYDLDDELLETVIISQGCASFTLEGGHNYLILEDNTLIMEYKTGPYEGQSLDKKFITNA